MLIAVIQRGSYKAKILPDCDHMDQIQADITRDVVQLLSSEFGFQPLGRVMAFPAVSCEEIHHTLSQLRPGLYWISKDGMEPRQQYCAV